LNGLTLLALIALVVGVVVAYRAGVLAGRREARARSVAEPAAIAVTTDSPNLADPAPRSVPPDASAASTDERARLIRSYASQADRAARSLVARDAEIARLRSLDDERRMLLGALADARAEAARYRQLVVDTENNAPPPLLESPTAPDDLKLIVGIGPVLERMLQQLGISTYRQIARWSERDIDEFDARLAEFPGRIRRDTWVTQARALHQSKYGDSAVSRERG
jgi:NADH-quinone oxidoreductase subunit E